MATTKDTKSAAARGAAKNSARGKPRQTQTRPAAKKQEMSKKQATPETRPTGTAQEPTRTQRTRVRKAYTVKVTVPPLDHAVVGTAVGAVRAPVTVARRVAPVAHGLPVYLGLGGLAAVGVVEWPIAAAAGAGFAALRRWGPLRSGAGEHPNAEHASGSAS